MQECKESTQARQQELISDDEVSLQPSSSDDGYRKRLLVGKPNQNKKVPRDFLNKLLPRKRDFSFFISSSESDSKSWKIKNRMPGHAQNATCAFMAAQFDKWLQKQHKLNKQIAEAEARANSSDGDETLANVKSSKESLPRVEQGNGKGYYQNALTCATPSHIFSY